MIYQIEAPWYRFQKQVKALFELDDDIVVGDIYETDGDTDYAFDIECKKHEKFIALDRLMPGVKTYGNVTLGIVLFDEEDNENDVISLYKTLFEGNPIVRSVETHTDLAGGKWNYVVFEPEIVQFFDDNLADYQGNWSGLAQDIAPDIFAENSRGVNFCTAAKNVDTPLGEWP